MSAPELLQDVDPTEVRKIRNRYNLIALMGGIVLCIVSFGTNLVGLLDDQVDFWRLFWAAGPLAIAWLLVRQLARYSDTENG